MWENIKKDPLIKTIVVIIIGVLAFGFAFNIMFGSGASAMEEGSASMSTGYSLGNTLESIIALLIKVAIIGALIGIIVWIFRTIGNRAGTNQAGTRDVQNERFAWMKEDPIIRNALIIIGAVVVLTFIFSLFRGFTITGNGEREMMNNGYNSYSGISYGFQSLLVLLVKLLIVLSLFGLGYGVIMYVKENQRKYTTIDNSDATAGSKAIICPDCNEHLKENWKCCPNCGSDKAYENMMK